jgi:hypothetical protein
MAIGERIGNCFSHFDLAFSGRSSDCSDGSIECFPHLCREIAHMRTVAIFDREKSL